MINLMPRRLLASSATFLASFVLAASSSYAAVEIEQQPLLVAQPVPGNMAILGSFEFPTMVTRAYKEAFSTTGEYVGYFDSAKCYKYNFSTTETQRHFFPVRLGVDCNQADEWSGQYLNWATMQSIDIFRHILTGGYRHIDTATETWLEKGVQTGQGGAANNFPDANITSNVTRTTPTTWTRVNTRIGIANNRMGNKMRFTQTGNLNNAPTAYNPAIHGYGTGKTFNEATVFEVSVRVRVCMPGLLEANCQRYENGHKPEGLIQANSSNMRYSAFGYINDNSGGSGNRNSEGGILHARMKYVGPVRVDDNNNEQVNPNKEWDERTGVFIANPDPADAAATPSGSSTIVNSGVISYINKSGLIRNDTEFKRFDNVGELYYAAYRYMKGLGNVPEYINLPTNADARARLVGGLPIINWTASEADDPIQFACQNNFFLGIGDTNTHPDTRIPKSDDPLTTAQFNTLRSQISTREGGLSFGSGTSEYLSVLAYDANTSDLRPNMEGKQTVSTYWIDILESGLKRRQSNAYWLGAKYGGLKVSDDFNPYSPPANLPTAAWHTTGDILSTGDLRPDNFHVVANAQDMVRGLTQAFSDIQTEQTGNRSSLALNSTALQVGSASFQGRYTSGSWTGEVLAFTADTSTGQLSPAPAWTASSKLPTPANRVIKTWNGSAFVNFATGTGGINNTALTNALAADSGGTAANAINYLRGVRTNENNATGFRVRQGLIGDIVNSQPVFVGKPTPGLFRNQTFNGSSSYVSWANGLNRTPVVYVGSNGGMLHGFNATTGATASGVETFAYVPRTVIENGMGELARPNYDHRYFVDGEITVADAYDGTNWRTILVGTLGAGGINKARDETRNAIFALDVTNPNNVQFLWEKNSTDTDMRELGNNLGKPVIAQIANGNWSVLLGNGPNGFSGRASLISVNLFSGVVTTTNMSTDINNGLSAVRAWDSDGNGITDTIYAGDLQGNLWKVTGLANNPRTVVKLFRALDPSNNPQPITSSPLAGRSPFSQEVWLFFGTGQYLNNADLTNTQVQSWYGINDSGLSTTATRADDLVERRILLDVAVSTEVTARVIEPGAREDLRGKRGWYIDLYQVGANGTRTALGERMITPNQFQGSALISNTRIPDASDPCAPTGRGVIMSIDPFTGARLADTYFDLNADRTFDTLDMVEINGVMTVVSGIGLNTGFSNPSFLDQKMYIPTDDGNIRDLDINPFSIGSGRTSWRELINMDN